MIVSVSNFNDFYEISELLETKDSTDSTSNLIIQFKTPQTFSLSSYLNQLEQYTYQIQNWYTELETVTMETYFYNLSEKEINVLLKWNTTTSIEAKNSFIKCIQKHFLSKTKSKGVWFIRTGECSPKDEKNSKIELQDKQSITNGITMIVNSDRCRNGWISYPNLCEDIYKPVIALRVFQDCTDEYRCFIFNGKLTGICEHNGRTSKYSKKAEAKKFIDKVSHYVSKKVIPLLPFQQTVLDICTLSDEKFIVIECNPLNSKWTGSALFDWKEDAYLLYDTTNVTYRFQKSNSKVYTLNF